MTDEDQVAQSAIDEHVEEIETYLREVKILRAIDKSKFLPPTFEQLDELLFRLYLAAVDSPRANVVVSQALYNANHRSMLVRWWQKMGHVVLVYRAHSGFWRNLRQLWRRDKGLRWVLFWLASKPWFERGDGDKFDRVLP